MESCNNGPSAFPRFLHQEKSTSNGNLTATSPEEIIIRRHSTSSSSGSDEADCQIVEDADDDILETLDRKVSEVIKRSRLNSSNNSQMAATNNNSDKYGPLSFSYNRRASVSPKPLRRTSASTGTGLVRFDDDDEEDDRVGGHLTDESSSSLDDLGNRVNWSDDEDEDGKKTGELPTQPPQAFPIKRKSISRKPIRNKGRQSSLSVYSVTTLSSEEGGEHSKPDQATTQDHSIQQQEIEAATSTVLI